MHKALHPRYDWLYVSKKGGRGLRGIDDSMDTSKRGLEYLKSTKKDELHRPNSGQAT